MIKQINTVKEIKMIRINKLIKIKTKINKIKYTLLMKMLIIKHFLIIRVQKLIAIKMKTLKVKIKQIANKIIQDKMSLKNLIVKMKFSKIIILNNNN